MIGKILDNRYQIKAVIGTGGMAIVYEGFDTILSRDVAIKILKDSFSENEEFVDRLKDEARNSASFSDENIVKIYDICNTKIDGKNIEYIVMEKIDGLTLKDIIQNDAPLDNDRIINYALQITKALQTAHMHGLVHRDIKPANILINSIDKVKVVDFGIARVSSDATLTYTSSILGTVHYISPEQAKGQALDSRSDLYSLGVILYEMATGMVPFDGESPVSIAVKHIQSVPEMVNKINPNISEDLSLIIAKLLQKDPENRYKTASNVLTDLTRISRGISLENTILLDEVDNNEIKNKSQSSYKSTKIKTNTNENNNKNKPLYFILYSFLAILFFLGVYFVSDHFIKNSANKDMVVMPSVVDISESSAITMLEERGLIPRVVNREFNSSIINGNIISQSISAQKSVRKGTIIELTISKGKELIKIPDLVGFDVNNIEKIVKDYGFEIGQKNYEESSSKKNKIIKQIPDAGEMAEKGSKIDLFISSGEAKKLSIVPNVENLDQETAINAIQSIGLLVGNISKQHNDVFAEGKVISQSLQPGKEVQQGTKMDIVISLGKETIKETETKIETVEDTTVETKEDKEDSKKEYVFNLTVPSGDSKTFSVKIYNISKNNELVYDNIIDKKQADENGKITISIIDSINSKFEVYYDGNKAQVN